MAENCKDCEERNPVIPTYSKAVPFVNENCGSCDDGGSIFNPPSVGGSGGGIPTIVTGISPIEVDDLSDSLAYKFQTRYAPVADLSVALTLLDVADAPFDPVILFGIIIDTIKLSWVYNRPSDIQTQTLTNNGGINAPTLLPTDNSYIYNSLSLGSSVNFTISGDDGQALPTSLASDTEGVVFGNYRTWGVGARKDLGSTLATEMIAFIEGLIGGAGTIELTTTRKKNPLIGEGATVNDYFYYAYPKDWGFATFLQNGFPGGFKRLANVGGTMIVASNDSLEAGELDLAVSNGVASQSYFVYQTTNGLAQGAEFEVI